MTSNTNHSLTQNCNPEEMLELDVEVVNPLKKDRLILLEEETRPQLITIYCNSTYPSNL